MGASVNLRVCEISQKLPERTVWTCEIGKAARKGSWLHAFGAVACEGHKLNKDDRIAPALSTSGGRNLQLVTAGAQPRRNDGLGDAHSPASVGFLQVAFAGHNRAKDLGDPATASAGLAKAFAMLSDAGVDAARLLTGLAPGADVLAAKAWRTAGLGPVQGVFPFLGDEPPREAASLMDAGTWLDGASTRAIGRNPHLTQALWMIGAADLLVVIWTGQHARGAGGTADAVRLALEHGIPVLWVRPGEPATLRLIRPEHLDEDFGFLEFLDELRLDRAPLVREASPEALRTALLDLGLGGGGPANEANGASSDAEAQTARIIWPWRAYALFRRTLGGQPSRYEARLPPPDLQAQPGFAALTRARNQAGRRAQELGAIHRSHQVILLAVAILAATAGSAAAGSSLVAGEVAASRFNTS